MQAKYLCIIKGNFWLKKRIDIREIVSEPCHLHLESPHVSASVTVAETHETKKSLFDSRFWILRSWSCIYVALGLVVNQDSMKGACERTDHLLAAGSKG